MKRLFQTEKTPLWVQIAVLSMIFLLLVSYFAGISMRGIARYFLFQQLRQQTKQMLSAVSGSAIEALIIEDVDILETITEQVGSSNKNLVQIAIKNNKWDELASWHSGRTTINLMSLSENIIFEQEKFGLIDMSWDLESNYKRIEDHVKLLRLLFILSLMIISGMIVGLVYRLTIHPIGKLDKRLVEISNGDFEKKVKISSSKEMNRLADSLNSMSEILFKEKQIEKEHKLQLERLNEAYFRFVPHELLDHLQKESILDISLGDQTQKNMSIMFSDIRSFTTLSENMSPNENFRFLNSYLQHMEPIIHKNNGFIDKFIGDAIMALFNEGDEALRSGIQMLKTLENYNMGRKRSGYKPIRIGIGINTGPLMLGTIGGKNRMEGTVISDTVNISSRIESLTKKYRTPFLISNYTFNTLKNPDEFLLRFVDKVKVKGKDETVILFEVFDSDEPSIKELKLKTKSIYNDAIDLYFSKNLKQTSQKFDEYLKIFPDDPLGEIYSERCKINQEDSSLSTWEGVTNYT